MTEPTNSSAKTPWHLWTVGVLSLFWNAMGALDFTMTLTNNAAYLQRMTPEQLAYIHGFPLWAVLAWGLGTWGGFLGSVVLLLRRNFAIKLFGASLVGVVFTNLYSYGLSDLQKVMHGGTGAILFSAVIFVIGVLLLVYARAMRRRGVLR